MKRATQRRLQAIPLQKSLSTLSRKPDDTPQTRSVQFR
jgi:hypothetical protein